MNPPLRRLRRPVALVRFTALALSVLLSATADAQQSPAEKLERARLEYSYKNFENAADLLASLLHPEIQLRTEDDIVAAREMLGLCYFYLGKEDNARQEFTALLYLRPTHRLDPFLIPPPAVEFFENVRSQPELAKQLKEIMERRQPPAEKPKEPVKLIRMERDVEVRSRLVAFLPFGLGQFQNGEKLKGALFAAGEGLSLAANIICYSLLVSLANENGRYAAGDIDLARGLRVGQYVSLGLFLAGWIAGAVEANIKFSESTPGPWRTIETETTASAASRLPALFFSWEGRW